MAFTVIDPSIIEAGDPTTQDLFNTVRLNFDDHETRLTSVEGGSSVNYIPFYWNLNGYYGEFVTLDNAVGVIRLPFNITLLGGRLLVNTAGTSGSTEIDFKYKRGAGAWTSVFSTKPVLSFSAGNDSIDSGVLSTTALLIGDLVRMDLTSSQNGDPRGLTGLLEFSKT